MEEADDRATAGCPYPDVALGNQKVCFSHKMSHKNYFLLILYECGVPISNYLVIIYLVILVSQVIDIECLGKVLYCM